jgi:hypothetical protein
MFATSEHLDLDKHPRVKLFLSLSVSLFLSVSVPDNHTRQ